MLKWTINAIVSIILLVIMIFNGVLSLIGFILDSIAQKIEMTVVKRMVDYVDNNG